jgi:hypothetical protein
MGLNVASRYVIDESGMIIRGFDAVEPAVKPGSASLALLTVAARLISDPVRVIPLIAWLLYCWGLFFSSILPGVNALAWIRRHGVLFEIFR